MNWLELKDFISEINSEILNNNFEKMDELSSKLQEFFAQKNYEINELDEAKILIKNLSQNIENKMQDYQMALEKEHKFEKSIDIYKKNVQITEYE